VTGQSMTSVDALVTTPANPSTDCDVKVTGEISFYDESLHMLTEARETSGALGVSDLNIPQSATAFGFNSSDEVAFLGEHV
jgi:hypothetical protein